MAEAATQDADLLIRSNTVLPILPLYPHTAGTATGRKLGFSVLPKDTTDWRAGDGGPDLQLVDNLVYLLSHRHLWLLNYK